MWRSSYFKNITPNLQIADTSGVTKHRVSYHFHAVGIESHLALASQFLYLLTTTQTFPFLARKYPSKRKFNYGQIRGETAKIITYINQTQQQNLIKRFIVVLMKAQLPPEPTVLKIERNTTRIIV